MVDFHPKMVDRLAKRYVEEYNLGGPHRAARFAKTMFTNQKFKELVNKRVKELVAEQGDKHA